MSANVPTDLKESTAGVVSVSLIEDFFLMSQLKSLFIPHRSHPLK